MHSPGARPSAAEPAIAVVLGSAARPWPIPGCGCVACRSGTPTSAAALRVGALTLADGRLDAPDGSHELHVGERHQGDDIRFVALPGPSPERPAVVIGLGARIDGQGRTLLWCEGAGRLPDQTVGALAGAHLAGAALDVRPADGRPDPLHLAHTVARLRAAGALAPVCDVVAIGLTHQLHPGVLSQRLARWGARVAADGAQFAPVRQAAEATASGPGPATPEPLRTLVLGPASSGKSAVAEDLLAAEPRVLYAATGPQPDAEDAAWADRVTAHRARRPSWWDTDETGEIARLLTGPGSALLVDALGTWVAAAMGRAGAWDDAPGWRLRVEGEVDAVVTAWGQARRRAVAVGEEVGWGILPTDPGVVAFREVLSALTGRLAAESEQVLLVVAGRVVELP